MMPAKPGSDAEGLLATLAVGQARVEASQRRVEVQLRAIADALSAVQRAELRPRKEPTLEERPRRELTEEWRSKTTEERPLRDISDDTTSRKGGRREVTKSDEAGDVCDLLRDESLPLRYEGSHPVVRELATGVASTDSLAEVAPMLPKRWPRALRPRMFRAPSSGDHDNGVPEILALAFARTPQQRNSMRSQRPGEPRRFKLTSEFRSRSRLVIDIAGLFFLGYDLTIVPYMLAWDPTLGHVMELTMLTTAIFWTFDMLMSICGPTPDDLDENAPKKKRRAAMRYFRSWFWLDCPLVLTDWVNITMSLITGSGAGQGLKMIRLVKIAKSLRILAILKMMRVAKVPRFWSDFMDRSLSESSRVLLRLFAMFCAIIWLNHVLACIWYSIGTLCPSDTGAHWTQVSMGSINGGTVYMEAPPVYQYTTAYHWAMAQTTLGAMELSPANSWERAFNILCMLLALLCGSTLISTLSAMMVDVQMSHHERIRNLRLLRRFLRENAISGNLAMRAQRQAKGRLSEQNRVTRGDVVALSVLSQSLQKHLHREICEPKLVAHPFFRILHNVDFSWFEDFLSLAVQAELARQDDDIFFAGRPAKAAYHVSHGTVCYIQEPISAPVPEVQVQSVDKGNWLCESALWVEWMHVGSARAANTCELLVVDALLFLEAIKGHRIIGSIAAEYGVVFHSRVQDSRPPTGWWPTDLETPFTECADVVSLMPLATRVSIGRLASQTARCNGPLATLLGGAAPVPPTIVPALVGQVTNGNAVVVLKGTGELEVVQHRVACEIRGDGGRIFAQLGAWSGCQVKPRCQLPSVQQTEFEDAARCYDRLVSSTLYPLAQVLRIEHVERCVEKLGPFLGVDRQRVTRKVCAALTGEFEAPICAAMTTAQCRSTNGFNSRVRKWPSASSSAKFSLESFERFLEHQVLYFASDPVETEEDDEEEESEGFFYAWLSPEEMAYLSGPGVGDLAAWVHMLSPATQPRSLRVRSAATTGSDGGVTGATESMRSVGSAAPRPQMMIVAAGEQRTELL